MENFVKNYTIRKNIFTKSRPFPLANSVQSFLFVKTLVIVSERTTGCKDFVCYEKLTSFKSGRWIKNKKTHAAFISFYRFEITYNITKYCISTFSMSEISTVKVSF